MDLFLSDERVVSIEILWDHCKALYSMISSVQGLKYWNLYNMSLVESKKWVSENVLVTLVEDMVGKT